ncbi:MAG: ABC transporter substrate-binding protein [Planctomycetota bacterium]|jgi:iron complex transport system substrate-binding protein
MKSRYLIIILLFNIAAYFTLCLQALAGIVTDQLGRKITLPDYPQRVVSLAPSITEIIYALGQQHRLKGVTLFSDYPDAAKKLPIVGSYVHLDLEKIVALRPDLCIAIKDGNPKEVIDRLDSLKIPVYAVDPKNLDSVMETLQEIAQLLGADDTAKFLIRSMKSRIDRVTSRVATTDSRPRVFFQIGISPIISVGSDTFIHEIIVLAGGKNLAEGRIPYPRFSQEQVLGLSPEVFVLTSMARTGAFEKAIAKWERWTQLDAVRSGRIHLVDSNLFDRPSPRLVEALEVMAHLIHPELFEETK